MRFEQEGGTLLGLYKWLEADIHTTSFLYHLVERVAFLPADRLLSSLYTTFEHSTILGDGVKVLSHSSLWLSTLLPQVELTGTLFVRTLQPYLAMLHQWTSEGTFDVPFPHFPCSSLISYAHASFSGPVWRVSYRGTQGGPQ